MCRLAAGRPYRRSVNRFRHLRLPGGPGWTLVETHHKIGTQSRLLGHRPLGGEDMPRPIVDRPELHPAVVDTRRVPQAEDLVASTVGKDRPIPLHEAV